MITRRSDAEWNGDLRSGNGTVTLGGGAFSGPYSFKSRFENAPATNPEELIAAAHAGCFSMALSAHLGGSGITPKRIHTTAAVKLEEASGGFTITTIELATEAEIPGMDDAKFQEAANAAKENCPVSKVLAGAKISLNAKLV